MNLVVAPNSPNPGGSYLVCGEGEDGISVELLTLDSVALARCDFIKIDVEGAELMAMKGARATLLRHRPLALSELHASQLRIVSGCTPTEYIAFMRGLGYTCIAIEDHRRGMSLDHVSDDEIGLVVNVVFAPPGRVGEVASALSD